MYSSADDGDVQHDSSVADRQVTNRVGREDEADRESKKDDSFQWVWFVCSARVQAYETYYVV